MKRLIFVLTLLIPFIGYASPIWEPSVALSVEYYGSHFNEVEDEFPLWGTARTGIELDALSFRFREKHGLSFPISVAYIADSNTAGRLIIPGAFAISLSAKYGYRITETFKIAASADLEALWHMKQDALSWRMGGTILLSYYPLPYLAIEVPIRTAWSPEAIHFSSGLMLRLILGGVI